MRTTVDLDDDVAAQLERLHAQCGKSLGEIVNEALRIGLARLENVERTTTGSFTRPVSVGQPRLPTDDVSEALAIADVDAFH